MDPAKFEEMRKKYFPDSTLTLDSTFADVIGHVSMNPKLPQTHFSDDSLNEEEEEAALQSLIEMGFYDP